MSAGAGVSFQPDRDTAKLAPKFRAAVDAALAECAAAGLDAFVYEAYRSLSLQEHYYARGRTVVPPTRPVTNARSNLYSWHGYGLAVDVISRSKLWGAGDGWFEAMAAVFKRHGCKWGGDWQFRDLPHVQWGRCRPSPSDRAREIIATAGLEGVWEAVGAAAPEPAPPPLPSPPAPSPPAPSPPAAADVDATLSLAVQPALDGGDLRAKVRIDGVVVASGIALPGEVSLGPAGRLGGKRIGVELE